MKYHKLHHFLFRQNMFRLLIRRIRFLLLLYFSFEFFLSVFAVFCRLQGMPCGYGVYFNYRYCRPQGMPCGYVGSFYFQTTFPAATLFYFNYCYCRPQGMPCGYGVLMFISKKGIYRVNNIFLLFLIHFCVNR